VDAAPPLSSGGAGGTSEGLPIEPVLIGFVYVYRAPFVVTVASGEPVEGRVCSVPRELRRQEKRTWCAVNTAVGSLVSIFRILGPSRSFFSATP